MGEAVETEEIMQEISLKDISRKLEEFAQERDWEKYHSPRNLLLAVAENNKNVLPDPDVVWFAEHTNLDGEGVLNWFKDGRSKDAQLHQLVKDDEKEPKGD